MNTAQAPMIWSIPYEKYQRNYEFYFALYIFVLLFHGTLTASTFLFTITISSYHYMSSYQRIFTRVTYQSQIVQNSLFHAYNNTISNTGFSNFCSLAPIFLPFTLFFQFVNKTSSIRTSYTIYYL